MKRIFPLFSIPLILFSFSLFSINLSKQKTAEEIIKKVDELYRSKSSYAVMEMQITTTHWKRTLKMKAWSIGMKKTFIRILSPKKDRGMANLRVGNEMWNYLPKVNKVIKIPPSMMMSSWMGSDFTNDDLVKEFTFINDYHFEKTKVKNPKKGMIYVKCKPKEGLPIVWGHVTIAVRENDYIPVWEKFYDEKGKLMRVMNFSDIKNFGNKKIPAKLEIIPKNKKNQKTTVTYIEAKFDIKLDKSTFTLRNLRTQI